MAANAYYGIGHAIKSRRPHYMLVFDAEGEQLHRVNNPEIRNRVQRVLDAIEKLAWHRIEMFDKKDGLIHVYHRDPGVDDKPATHIEELNAGNLGADRELARMAQIATVMGQHAERSQRLVMDMMKPLVDAVIKLNEVGWGKLSLYEKQYEHALVANQKLTSQLANAQAAIVRTAMQPTRSDEDERDDELDKVFDAVLPHLVKAATTPKDDDDAEPDKPPRHPSRNGKARDANIRRNREHGERVKAEREREANGAG